MKAILYFTKLKEEHEKREEHEVGMKLLSYGLLKEYGLTLQQEMLKKETGGKPYLSQHPQIHFNISHSEDYVVCGFAPVAIGLDVQKHKKMSFAAVAQRILPAGLAREILDGDHVTEAFFAQWVLRESYLKWTGEGLARDMRTVDMDEGWHTLLNVEPGYSGALWSSQPLEVEWVCVSSDSL